MVSPGFAAQGRNDKNPPYGGFLSFNRGFTLVELVVTIIIVGILAVAVMPRLIGNTGFDQREFRDRIAAALRYAQKSAIAARRTTCAAFSASPASVSFRVSTNYGAADCLVGTALTGVDGNSLVVTASGGVSFSTLPADVVFDSAGRPGGAGLISISGLEPSLAITVEAETGYVH